MSHVQIQGSTCMTPAFVAEISGITSAALELSTNQQPCITSISTPTFQHIAGNLDKPSFLLQHFHQFPAFFGCQNLQILRIHLVLVIALTHFSVLGEGHQPLVGQDGIDVVFAEVRHDTGVQVGMVPRVVFVNPCRE